MNTPTDDVRGHGEDGLREADAFLVTADRSVRLADCPIGLFMCRGELCLKTEYGNNEGRIDAFIVSSGEYFWGAHPQTIANQRAQRVVPVSVHGANLSATPIQPERGMVEALREAMVLIDELNERVESRKFYGIGQALHGKLCTVRATLQRAALSSLDSKGEGR